MLTVSVCLSISAGEGGPQEKYFPWGKALQQLSVCFWCKKNNQFFASFHCSCWMEDAETVLRHRRRGSSTRRDLCECVHRKVPIINHETEGRDDPKEDIISANDIYFIYSFLDHSKHLKSQSSILSGLVSEGSGVGGGNLSLLSS